jgi:hypothetical protein
MLCALLLPLPTLPLWDRSVLPILLQKHLALWGTITGSITNFATKAFCTLRNNNWINFATKAFCTLRNNNWIQLLFRKVQNAFVAKLVQQCALTKINSVTVGTEWPRPRMRNSCCLPNMRPVTGNPVTNSPCVSRELWQSGGLRLSDPAKTRTHGQNWHLWELSALPILLQKHFALCGTITGSSYCSTKCKMIL